MTSEMETGTEGSPTNGEELWQYNQDSLSRCLRYKYPRLKDRHTTRILMLRPDPNQQSIVQCELVTIALPEQKREEESDYDNDEEDEKIEKDTWEDPKFVDKPGDGPEPEPGEESTRLNQVEPTSTPKNQGPEYQLQSMLEQSQDRGMKDPPENTNNDMRKVENGEGEDHIAHASDDLPEKSLNEKGDASDSIQKPKMLLSNATEPSYEALSWCWDLAVEDTLIGIFKGEELFKKAVTRDMYEALQALRYPNRVRYLWIDAICINQKDLDERNQQVEMMSDIYGRAWRVCIWLGIGDNSSKMALEFIRNEVLQLENFDELCNDKENAPKWDSLLNLMQRPWFSRRWVVQEIALAREAVVYCGAERISWKKFAIAVELFIEVESATHRLSEVMKTNEKFFHIPRWFEFVSMLGASLLVEATGKLYRDWKPNSPIGHANDNEYDNEEPTRPLKPFRRGEPLLSVEYLVSSLSVFKVTRPHDAIYAMLAISKDAKPVAVTASKSAANEKSVQSSSPNPTDQMEMVTPPSEPNGTITEKTNEGFRTSESDEYTEGKKVIRHLPFFIERKEFQVDYKKPYSEVCRDFIQFCIEAADPTRALDILCRPWAPEPAENNVPGQDGDDMNDVVSNEVTEPGQKTTHSGKVTGTLPWPNPRPDMPLPTWIAKLSGAAYDMYFQPGGFTQRMGRVNADPLVGLPPSSQSLQRNYSAAGMRKLDLHHLRFRRRDQLSHYSMYVKGFVLDRVETIENASQAGAIPRDWAALGGWKDCPRSDPPDQFWRTLVADRGRDGKNPPVYYSRACKESFSKGGLTGGSVNTTDLISNERCSVIAQFCRRVQSVIWNRCLIKTEHGHLGLAPKSTKDGDLICILYGCSVPVVLRRVEKDYEQVRREVLLDRHHIQNEITTRIADRWRIHKKWKMENPKLADDDFWNKRERGKRRMAERDAEKEKFDRYGEDLKRERAEKEQKAKEEADQKVKNGSAQLKPMSDIGMQTEEFKIEKPSTGGPTKEAPKTEVSKPKEPKIKLPKAEEARTEEALWATHKDHFREGSDDSWVQNASGVMENRRRENGEEELRKTPESKCHMVQEHGEQTRREAALDSLEPVDQDIIDNGTGDSKTNTMPEDSEIYDDYSYQPVIRRAAEEDYGTSQPVPSGAAPRLVAPAPNTLINEKKFTRDKLPIGYRPHPENPKRYMNKKYEERLQKFLEERQGDPPDRIDESNEDAATKSRQEKPGFSEQHDNNGNKRPSRKTKQPTWKVIPKGPRYYKLIGEAYIHGMMDGEAIGYQNRKSIPPQTFELR